MSNSFNELGLSEPILKALKEMEFQQPTEIQTKAIPHVLNGKDVIVASKTGSGKTAVFGVSVLQLTDPSDQGPQCLILEPTRELAVQVDNELKKMAKHVAHTSTAVYGQHNMNTEIRALQSNVTIVTGTPGRVYDHIDHGNLKTKNIKFLVLDEVDRMMDMGFIDQVRRIIRTLPRKRVTLLFSATIPQEIARLCRQYMRDPVTIEIQSETRTVDTIEQRYYRVERNEKRTQLNRLLLTERPETCMIFCNTKIAVDQVQSFLTRKGYASKALHGDIPQNKRMKNIQQFKKGSYQILVATDVAARGIHVEDLSLVINYDVPLELDGYIHRIGRTGRAGHDGSAISLVTGEDIMTLYAVEEHIGTMIPQAQLPTDEELAEQKELSEAWIQAHALKGQPGRQTSRSGSGGSYKGGKSKSKRRQYQKKPYQKGGRQGQDQREAQRQDQGRQASTAQSDDSRKTQAQRQDVARHTQQSASTSKQAQQSANRQTQQGANRQTQQGASSRQQHTYASSAEQKTSSYNRNKDQSGNRRKLYQSEHHKDARTAQSEQRTGATKAKSAAQLETNKIPTSEKKSFLKRVIGKIMGK